MLHLHGKLISNVLSFLTFASFCQSRSHISEALSSELRSVIRGPLCTLSVQQVILY